MLTYSVSNPRIMPAVKDQRVLGVDFRELTRARHPGGNDAIRLGAKSARAASATLYIARNVETITRLRSLSPDFARHLFGVLSILVGMHVTLAWPVPSTNYAPTRAEGPSGQVGTRR
jgi:hypothetical protein